MGEDIQLLVATVIGGLGGGLGSWIINLLKERSKSNLEQDELNHNQKLEDLRIRHEHAIKDSQLLHEQRISENTQALQIYQEIVDELREQVARLSSTVSVLEKQNRECQRENAQIKADLKILKNELKYLMEKPEIKENN